MKNAVDMASGGMMYVTSFMKIGAGIQAIILFCLNNMKVCKIGITDGRNL
jgi:hypothetical protein